MPLSCVCYWDYDFDPGDWYYDEPEPDFEPLATSRRKRCCSCGELIDIGALCLVHKRSGYPRTEAEARINGFESLEDAMNGEAIITLAPHYQCEKCGEIWLNLQSVGFVCLYPSENMPEMLKDYQHDYAPPKISSV